ncbi:hypothetical protein H9P43_000431 [Blastocladiella emersonii ATCC 22665]|nr:hypothetical protein H9P43_000431 [Blastocladiella emersonii ATCC 22665]
MYRPDPARSKPPRASAVATFTRRTLRLAASSALAATVLCAVANVVWASYLIKALHDAHALVARARTRVRTSRSRVRNWAAATRAWVIAMLQAVLLPLAMVVAPDAARRAAERRGRYAAGSRDRAGVGGTGTGASKSPTSSPKSGFASGSGSASPPLGRSSRRPSPLFTAKHAPRGSTVDSGRTSPVDSAFSGGPPSPARGGADPLFGF